ncbi:ABC transporter permease subunit [bacterium]|nr:ABC transporter permease subunit [bacterium]
MKTFLAFVKKEFFHILRDRRTLLILFGMPIAQILIFGFALNNEINNAGLVVLNRAGDYESKQLLAKFQNSTYFNLQDPVFTEAAIEQAFKDNRAKVALIIPLDFGKNMQAGNEQLRIIGDATDPNQAQTLVNYAKAIIADYLQQKQNTNTQLPITTAQPRMLFNPELKAVYQFVPGVMGLILLLVSAMMTSLTIAKEKELGTMELLLISPLKPFHIILGKVAPYWVLSFLNAVIIIILGVFVFGMPVNGSVPLLLLVTLIFSFASLALGIFISSKANSQLVAMFLSMFGLLLPTLLLSGFIFPIENMPLPLRIISNIVPARWFIELIKGIMIKGSPLSLLIKPFLVLCFITVVLTIAGIKGIKTRLS